MRGQLPDLCCALPSRPSLDAATHLTRVGIACKGMSARAQVGQLAIRLRFAVSPAQAVDLMQDA
eukprot:6581371-Pyramimonas_sp.AAC.1